MSLQGDIVELGKTLKEARIAKAIRWHFSYKEGIMIAFPVAQEINEFKDYLEQRVSQEYFNIDFKFQVKENIADLHFNYQEARHDLKEQNFRELISFLKKQTRQFILKNERKKYN